MAVITVIVASHDSGRHQVGFRYESNTLKLLDIGGVDTSGRDGRLRTNLGGGQNVTVGKQGNNWVVVRPQGIDVELDGGLVSVPGMVFKSGWSA